MPNKPKLMVIGHAGHGKDSTCDILRDLYGFTFISSSLFVADKAVRPSLQKMGIIYPTLEDCYNDRANHRADWFNAIAEYNKYDAAKLGRELFAEYDIYCGLRNRREFDALKAENAFHVCFWVDRSEVVEPEDTTSNTLTMQHADYVIDNNGPLEDLEVNILEVMDRAMDDGKIPHITPTF